MCIVCENLGFGWLEIVYFGVIFFLVGCGLEMVIKLGYKKIVVVLYFFFGGKLIDWIYVYVDKVVLENFDINFIKIDYLCD